MKTIQHIAFDARLSVEEVRATVAAMGITPARVVTTLLFDAEQTRAIVETAKQTKEPTNETQPQP